MGVQLARLQYLNQMMEITQYNSNKYLQNAITDPLVNIFRQLRDLGAQEGDYIKIIEKETYFQPIYKISYLQERKSKQEQGISIRKSLFRDSSNEAGINDNKVISQNQQKFRLSFGSQIYLKYNNLLHAKIALLKPTFPNLFLQLRIRGKGYIHCIDSNIIINNLEKTESIWMCISSIVDQSRQLMQQQTKNEVIFCNFVQNQYLNIDINGLMTVCQQQKATRFTLRRVGTSNDYVLQGRNVLSQLIRNKSKQEIKKIIDRSIERNEGSKSSLEVQLEITPVQDTMITIHLELNYSKKALQREPSLKLIKLILNELIYYDILDFLRDGSILSEHIQELLLEYQILTLIQNHLEKYFAMKRDDDDIPIMILPKRLSGQQHESKFLKRNSKVQYDQLLIYEILKIIGLLCRQNIQVSKIFVSLLDLLIIKQHYNFAVLLLQGNQFFLSQFHKANWYAHLYRLICRCSKEEICKVVNFLCSFCQSSKQLTLNGSIIEYRHRPSTNNQYLLYHSIKTGDFFSKIFQYQLYLQGIYVFVHDTKSGRDVQFHTFVEGLPSESSQPKRESSIKIQLEDSIHQQSQAVQLLLGQLKLLKSLYHNYNPNIILGNWAVVYGLAPYCYKDNFPQIINTEIKSIIFKLLIELEPFYKEAKLLSTFLISCSLVESDNFTRNTSNQEQSKIYTSNFIKNNKKRIQTSRKILKQMGNHFLKKARDWSQSIRKRTLQISEICNNKQDYYFSQWLQIMTQALNIRLFKVKEKKEGQLLGYIKKLFESIQDKKGVVENEGNLMNQFMELLLEIVKTNPKYDKYLQQIKAKRAYDGKSNQINKVISNLQGKKQVNFTRNQKGLTKIELIDLVYKGLSRQENIRESSRRQVQIINYEQFQAIKLTSLRIIQLMILNVNEEMVDEAIDTLTYLIKNPSTISSFSSFSLLDIIPKYPYQNLLKRIIIQQWYLQSNCQFINEFLEILRLIYTKKMIYRRNINNVLLIDSQSTFKTYHHIVYPVKFLKKVANHCQSWLRPSLLDKYPDIYLGVDKNLQIIIDCLQKMLENGQHLQVAKIIENVDLLSVLQLFLEYISSYYLQQQTESPLQKSRMFHMKSQLTFVESKLNPLVEKILKIILTYVYDTNGNQMFRSKMIIHTFGQIFSSILQFVNVFIQIFKKCVQSFQENLLELLQTISPAIAYNLTINYHKSWKFYQCFCYLEGEDLLRELNILYKHSFYRFGEIQQQIFVRNFISSCNNKNSHDNNSKQQISDDKYEFSHQIVLMKIMLKLIYNNFLIDIVYWFKQKVFLQLIQTITKNNSQNYYMLELSNQQIKRRQLVAQLAFYLKDMEVPQSQSLINQRDENEAGQLKSLIVDFMVEEHQLSKLYIELDSVNNKKIRKISDSAYIEYLQYLVCDIIVLAYSMDFLSVGELYDDFSQYFDKLKQIYKRRVTYKSNEQTYISFSNVQKLFWKETNTKYQCKPRVIKFDRLILSSADNTSEQQKPQSKPIRKWMKAVTELNKEKFLSKYPEFIEDMLTFEQIYQLKNQNEEINLVINHNDIFLKYLQVSLNMKRLKINMENQIFVLQSLLLLAKSRHKNKKQLDSGLMHYGTRLLQLLLEEQNINSYEDKQLQRQGYQKWKNNTYCLSLMLRIIEYSRCLEFQRIWSQFIYPLMLLFMQSLDNYQTDCHFLQLYFSTLHSKEELQLFQLIIPFEAILSIFAKQITITNLSFQQQKLFAGCVLRAYLSLNFNLQCNFRCYTSSQLLKIIDSVDKNNVVEVYNQLNQNLYFKHLLTFKK